MSNGVLEPSIHILLAGRFDYVEPHTKVDEGEINIVDLVVIFDLINKLIELMSTTRGTPVSSTSHLIKTTAGNVIIVVVRDGDIV